MARLMRGLFALGALPLTICSLVVPAAAQEPAAEVSEQRKEAEARYKRALELFDDGSYDASLLELERAYELAPSYRILYNIALVNVQLNDYAAALDAFERYLRDGGDEVPRARRQEVERQIEQLTTRVGYLSIRVDEEGSEIAIDGKPLGKAPLPERVRVNAGRRKVLATSGERRQERQVELAGGDVVELEFRIAAPPPPPPPPPAPPPAPPPPPPPERRVPWLAWGVTGTLAAGAATTGILALSAHSEQTELKGKLGATRSELDDADSKVQTWALVTDVLAAATLVSAGVALYLTLKPSDAPGEAGQTTLVIGPRGVAAHVSF